MVAGPATATATASATRVRRAVYQRAQYAELRRLGICGRCRQRDVAPGAGNATCEQCRARERDRYHAGAAKRQRDQRAERKAAGQCIECGGPCAPGRRGGPGSRYRPYVRCATCRAAAAAYATCRRERIREEGAEEAANA